MLLKTIAEIGTAGKLAGFANSFSTLELAALANLFSTDWKVLSNLR